MANSGKNINYYLMDGSPSGRIKCTISNWTGVAYRIPRTELEKCRERDDLKQSGVYFLYGEDEVSGRGVVYVGQAGVRKNGEGIIYRLQEHKRSPDKDYWTEAVVFTTSNNSFGPTEISWLENRFCVLATETGRYIVKNGNDPNIGNVTEEKQSELEEFAQYAIIVMGVLGHKVFEPLTHTIAATDASVTTHIVFAIDMKGKKQSDEVASKGTRTTEGFVMLKGSKIKVSIAPSLRVAIKTLRTKYCDRVTADGILLEDILFRSPNEAAQFAVGYPINALITWKTADGKTLREIEESET